MFNRILCSSAVKGGRGIVEIPPDKVFEKSLNIYKTKKTLQLETSKTTFNIRMTSIYIPSIFRIGPNTDPTTGV